VWLDSASTLFNITILPVPDLVIIDEPEVEEEEEVLAESEEFVFAGVAVEEE
jgi:hypothetical protein